MKKIQSNRQFVMAFFIVLSTNNQFGSFVALAFPLSGLEAGLAASHHNCFSRQTSLPPADVRLRGRGRTHQQSAAPVQAPARKLGYFSFKYKKKRFLFTCVWGTSSDWYFFLGLNLIFDLAVLAEGFSVDFET